MASETSETIADIVAKMRKYRDLVIVQNNFADRIEAAAKRAYNDIDSAVCGIEDISHYDIDDVRKAMEKTIGDYYE